MSRNCINWLMAKIFAESFQVMNIGEFYGTLSQLRIVVINKSVSTLKIYS